MYLSIPKLCWLKIIFLFQLIWWSFKRLELLIKLFQYYIMSLVCWCYQFASFVGGGGGHYVLPANILFIHIKVNLSKRDCTFYVSSAHLAVKIMPSLAWSSIMTMLIYYNVFNSRAEQEFPARSTSIFSSIYLS